MSTHCLRFGALGSGELPVPGVPGIGSFTFATAAQGSRRGTAVLFHGLSLVTQATPLSTGVDSSFFGFSSYMSQLRTNLLADGWNVLYPAYAEDGTSTLSPSQALCTSVNGDIGVGEQYLNTTITHLDHIFAWCRANAPGAVFPMGISHGGWNTLVAGAFRGSQIAAGIAHVPATLWQNSSPAFTSPVSFYSFNMQGLEAQPNWLANCPVPMLVSYGINDEAAGYGGLTTVSSASSGVDVATFVGSGVLNLTATTNINVGPLVRVLTDQGWAFIKFSGTTSTTLTGCTTVAGAGHLITGNPAWQSNTLSIIANGSAKVTANATADFHELQLADVGTQYNAAGPTALSSFVGTTTLPFVNAGTASPNSVPSFVSGQTAILGSDGLWHTITFSAVTLSGFTNASISSPGSATVVQGAPIGAFPVSGSRQSFNYWWMNNVDTICPAVF